MSSIRPPKGFVEPPPPVSEVRYRRKRDAFKPLSSDGAAAVLLFLRERLGGKGSRPLRPVARSLQAFAERVAATTRSMTERVHDDCVLIAPLFHELRECKQISSTMALSAFKRQLVKAHRNDLLVLDTCIEVEFENLWVMEASAIYLQRATFHMVHRRPPYPRVNVRTKLDETLAWIPLEFFMAAEVYAQKVHKDELLREGRPRLITLPLDAFAQRVQTVVNKNPHDMPIATLFLELDDLGEVTGLRFSTFKARLHTAHRKGLLALRAWEPKDGVDGKVMVVGKSRVDTQVAAKSMRLHLVQRTDEPLPIPWARAALPLPCPWTNPEF